MLKATQQDQGQEETWERGRPVKDGRKCELKQEVKMGKVKVGTEIRGRTGKEEEEQEKEQIEQTETRKENEEITIEEGAKVKTKRRVEQNKNCKRPTGAIPSAPSKRALTGGTIGDNRVEK